MYALILGFHILLVTACLPHVACSSQSCGMGCSDDYSFAAAVAACPYKHEPPSHVGLVVVNVRMGSVVLPQGRADWGLVRIVDLNVRRDTPLFPQACLSMEQVLASPSLFWRRRQWIAVADGGRDAPQDAALSRGERCSPWVAG